MRCRWTMSSPRAFRAIQECRSKKHLSEMMRFYLRSVTSRAGYVEVIGTVACGELLPADSWGDVDQWTEEQRRLVDERVIVWAQKEWRIAVTDRLHNDARKAALRAIEDVYAAAGIQIHHATTRQVARSIFANGADHA